MPFAVRKEFSIPKSLHISSVLTAMKLQRKDGPISLQQPILREVENKTILSYSINSALCGHTLLLLTY